MTTKTFQQLIDDHQFKLVAQAATQAQMAEAEERQRRREFAQQNAVLRERGRELLGAALFDELARPSPEDDVYVPLVFAPGPDVFLRLVGRNDINLRLALPADDYGYPIFIELPADENAIAGALFKAHQNYKSSREFALSQFKYHVRDDDEPENMRADLVALWPDLEDETLAVLAAELERRAVRAEKQAVKEERERQKDDQLLDAIRNDSVLAHVVKLVVAIQADRERYEEAVAGLDETLESERERASQRLAEAKQTIEKASRRERELEQQKSDAQDEAERYQNKLRKAGVR